jgi:hypothetical protein
MHCPLCGRKVSVKGVGDHVRDAHKQRLTLLLEAL